MIGWIWCDVMWEWDPLNRALNLLDELPFTSWVAVTRNKFLRIHMKSNKGTCYGLCKWEEVRLVEHDVCWCVREWWCIYVEIVKQRWDALGVNDVIWINEASWKLVCGAFGSMWRKWLGVIDNWCSLNGRHFLESYPVTIRNVHRSKKLKTFGLGVTLWIPIMINWRATCGVRDLGENHNGSSMLHLNSTIGPTVLGTKCSKISKNQLLVLLSFCWMVCLVTVGNANQCSGCSGLYHHFIQTRRWWSEFTLSRNFFFSF